MLQYHQRVNYIEFLSLPSHIDIYMLYKLSTLVYLHITDIHTYVIQILESPVVPLVYVILSVSFVLEYSFSFLILAYAPLPK